MTQTATGQETTQQEQENAFSDLFPAEYAAELITQCEEQSIDPYVVRAYAEDIVGMMSWTLAGGYVLGAYSAEELVEKTLEAYQGEFRSMQEFAEQLVDDTGMLDQVPENLRYYFDYAAFARDLELGGDYRFCSGYVFDNNC